MDDIYDLNDYENEVGEEEKKEEVKEKVKEEKKEEEKSEEEKKEEAKEEKKEKVLEIVPPKQEKEKKISFALEDTIPLSNYTSIPSPAMTFPFELDTFQKRGIIRVENHENVLVCAHTSSGKTVVAEYAIAKSKKSGNRIIYTSPIKALSNQKYRDFKSKFDDVGVVTGDVSINPDAQCLIMTTEILQNMLYKQSEKLKMVDYIIFDEVHYINDRERGHVWEEILILLPKTIGLVMLSATIPNYFEFAQWIGSIKKSTIYIEITYKRVVPLEHKIYINTKNVFVFKGADDKIISDNLSKAIKMVDEENKRINIIRSKPQGKKERMEREEKLFHQIKTFNQFLMKREKEKYNEDFKTGNTITLTHLKIEEIVTYINKQKLTPVVLFTFSIRTIDEYSKMLSKNQYTTPSESNRIINFFDKCVSKLSEEDRKIGQIKAFRQLLPSGVGVHHSGLLPILKEIIEILYSKGLIKILFATTSFSIGLNMPTRTVVFTDITKYSEGKKQLLSSSEYLQMCGRAGRRGIDDKGNVFILLGDKKSSYKMGEIENMAKGGGTSVESKFRLSYKTLINFFYRNLKNIVDFFKESYIENSTFISMPEIRKKISTLKKELDNTKKINCKYDIETIGDYYDSNSKLRKVRKNLYSQSMINELITTRGRVLVYYDKKQMKNIFITIVKYYTDYEGEIWCLKVNDDTKVVIEYQEKNKGKIQHQLNTSGICNGKYFEYFVIYIEDIVDICNYTIKSCNKKLTVQNDDGFDFYQKSDIDSILKELNKINQPDEIVKNTVKVVDYLKISRNEINVHNWLKDKDALTSKQIANQCNECPLKFEHKKQYEGIKSIKDKLKENEKKISEENIRCFKEFESRKKVLRKLEYINDDNQLLLKGKAAKEITSADCVLVTEVLLSNIIDKLTIDELIAFLSCFVNNKNEVEIIDPEISDNFTKAVEDFKKILDNIAEIEIKENLEESKYNRTVSFSISYPIQMWMQGKHFNEILDECEMEEGKVFNLINRLNLFISSICEFYKVLGNTTLGEKFEKAKEILLREIMTFRSLYLEEDINFDSI